MEDQVRVSLRSVQACGYNGKKLRKPAIVYKKTAIVNKMTPSGNSKLAGRKIAGVASDAKCWRQ